MSSLIQITWVIAAMHPKEIASFYSNAFDIDFYQVDNSGDHWLSKSDGADIQIYKPSDQKPFPSRGKAGSICFSEKSSGDPLSQIKEWIQKLSEYGAKTCEDFNNKPFGVECWMQDPEGNYFLLLVKKD
tara:strand:+ start:31302 stop:31688 length:387 start_codon:yes stop_codon:yes gene_type:complete